MKIRITKYVYVHFQSQALSPQWGQQENEEMTDRHRTHTKSRVLCIGISGGPTTPRYSTHLLCRVKQRGEVSTYNWTRRSSCYIQISKETGLIVHSLIKGRDLTTHYRRSLCGDHASSPKHLGTETDGDIFCTQSTLILSLPRKSLPQAMGSLTWHFHVNSMLPVMPSFIPGFFCSPHRPLPFKYVCTHV